MLATQTLLQKQAKNMRITVDGELKFSKKALGRFPTDVELDALVAT